MKAMILQGSSAVEAKPLQLVGLPDPKPRTTEILIRVHICAVCRTDLHVIEGDLPAVKRPLVPGHQVVGVVEEIGSDVTDFTVGDRVGIAWVRMNCRKCPECERGDENLCRNARYTGHHEDGGYAEKAVVPARYAYRIPDGFTDTEAAPLLCSGIIGYRALKRSRVEAGEKLGLIGFGSSAHITLGVAKALGMEVFAVSRQKKHQELALELGATWAGPMDRAPPVELDGAILFAPVGDLVPASLRLLRRGGTLAIAGIHLTPIPSMEYQAHLFHEKSLTSVEANTRLDGIELLSLAARHQIKPRVETLALDQANEALIRLKKGEVDGSLVLRIQ